MNVKKILWLAPAALVIFILSRLSSWFAEYILARGIFRIFAVPIGFLTGFLPFSLAEILLYLTVVTMILLLVKFLFLMTRPGRFEVIRTWGLRFIATVSVLAFLFTVLCGGLYYRIPMSSQMNLKVQKYSREELYQTCLYLADLANQTKAEVTQTDDKGVVVVEDMKQLSADVATAYKNLEKKYPVFRYSTGKVKPVLFSRAMSYTGIVGIYCPFTVEANVNTDVAGYNRAADAAHELAHLHGFMQENEANFISYLACEESDKAYVRYSGIMLGFIYCANALYEEDQEMHRQLFDGLSEGVKADLIYENEYWDFMEKSELYEAVETASDKVNDTYLKVNGQKEGVKSYGRVVDLLIAYIGTESKESGQNGTTDETQ